jgi:hypothetical protein
MPVILTTQEAEVRDHGSKPDPTLKKHITKMG